MASRRNRQSQYLRVNERCAILLKLLILDGEGDVEWFTKKHEQEMVALISEAVQERLQAVYGAQLTECVNAKKVSNTELKKTEGGRNPEGMIRGENIKIGYKFSKHASRQHCMLSSDTPLTPTSEEASYSGGGYKPIVLFPEKLDLYICEYRPDTGHQADFTNIISQTGGNSPKISDYFRSTSQDARRFRVNPTESAVKKKMKLKHLIKKASKPDTASTSHPATSTEGGGFISGDKLYQDDHTDATLTYQLDLGRYQDSEDSEDEERLQHVGDVQLGWGGEEHEDEEEEGDGQGLEDEEEVVEGKKEPIYIDSDACSEYSVGSYKFDKVDNPSQNTQQTSISCKENLPERPLVDGDKVCRKWLDKQDDTESKVTRSNFKSDKSQMLRVKGDKVINPSQAAKQATTSCKDVLPHVNSDKWLDNKDDTESKVTRSMVKSGKSKKLRVNSDDGVGRDATDSGYGSVCNSKTKERLVRKVGCQNEQAIVYTGRTASSEIGEQNDSQTEVCNSEDGAQGEISDSKNRNQATESDSNEQKGTSSSKPSATSPSSAKENMAEVWNEIDNEGLTQNDDFGNFWSLGEDYDSQEQAVTDNDFGATDEIAPDVNDNVEKLSAIGVQAPSKEFSDSVPSKKSSDSVPSTCRTTSRGPKRRTKKVQSKLRLTKTTSLSGRKRPLCNMDESEDESENAAMPKSKKLLADNDSDSMDSHYFSAKRKGKSQDAELDVDKFKGHQRHKGQRSSESKENTVPAVGDVVDLCSEDEDDDDDLMGPSTSLIEVIGDKRDVKRLNDGDIEYLMKRNKQYFKHIFSGKIPCRRHQDYKAGGYLRGDLDHSVRFGPFSDEQQDTIMTALTRVFCRKHNHNPDLLMPPRPRRTGPSARMRRTLGQDGQDPIPQDALRV